jgi:hypothetical protein
MEQNGRDKSGRFANGNGLWKLRVNTGPRKKYATADELRLAFLNYFSWAEENPLFKDKVFTYRGKIISEPFPQPRPMSIRSLLSHLNISKPTWLKYCKDPDLSEVCEEVKDAIFTQKFEGAAVGLFNPAIIARELGLKGDNEFEVEAEQNYELPPAVQEEIDRICGYGDG